MFEVSRYLPGGSGRRESPGETDDEDILSSDAVCDVDFIRGEVMVKFDGGECVSYFNSECLG